MIKLLIRFFMSKIKNVVHKIQHIISIIRVHLFCSTPRKKIINTMVTSCILFLIFTMKFFIILRRIPRPTVYCRTGRNAPPSLLSKLRWIISTCIFINCKFIHGFRFLLRQQDCPGPLVMASGGLIFLSVKQDDIMRLDLVTLYANSPLTP